MEDVAFEKHIGKDMIVFSREELLRKTKELTPSEFLQWIISELEEAEE